MKLAATARRADPWLVLVLVVAAPLYLVGLDWPLLWQDEAETALLGRRVLEHGYPFVGEGATLISQDGGVEAGAGGFAVYHGPLQAYVTAFSFAILGESTRSARLPFALCGLATAAGVYFLAGGRRRHLARLAAALTAFSVPFILHARQCRYYALAALGITIVLLGYRLLVEAKTREERRRATVLAAAAGVWLVLAHDLLALCAAASVSAHFLLIERRRIGIAAFARTAALPALAFVGWGALASTSERYSWLRFENYFDKLDVLIVLANAHIFPFALVAAVLAVAGVILAWRRSRRSAPTERIHLEGGGAPALSAPSLAALVVLAGGAVLASHAVLRVPYFRYVVPLVPLAAVALAVGLEPLLRIRHRAGRLLHTGAAVLLMVTAGLTSLSTEALALAHPRVRQGPPPSPVVPLVEYLSRRGDRSLGPISAVVSYLEEHAAPGETMVATYGDLPLRYYTELEVYGGLSGEFPSGDRPPDWIWARTHAGPGLLGRPGEAARWLQQNVDAREYEAISLSAPDRPWEHRPDPAIFYSQSRGNAPRVMLFRRRGPAPEPAPELTTPAGP